MKEHILVFVDGKRVVKPLDWNIKEGWVEVPNLEQIAEPVISDCRFDPIAESKAIEVEEIPLPTKKLYGKVEVKKIIPAS